MLERTMARQMHQSDATRHTYRQVSQRGFTLVEILIVVVILGILAAIAVPKLSNASQLARENTLRDEVRYLRTQISVYHAHHHDVYPGYPGGNTASTPTDADFAAQMTLYTDEWGNTATSGSNVFKFGPYLHRMPDNSVNHKATIKIISDGSPLTPDGTTGWLYQAGTGQILPNIVGADSDGKSFQSY